MSLCGCVFYLFSYKDVDAYDEDEGGFFLYVWFHMYNIKLRTRVIRIHWIIRNHRKDMDERAVFSHIVDSNLRSCWGLKNVSPCAIFPRDHGEAHYTLRNTRIVYFSFLGGFILWLCLMVSGSMEPF